MYSAPIIFIKNPTASISLKETFFTPPNANPFTPVAMGLINAQVLESVTIIKASIAEKFRSAESGTTIRNKLN